MYYGDTGIGTDANLDDEGASSYSVPASRKGSAEVVTV